MVSKVMIGTVMAFAGQVKPVSGDANNIWKDSGCSSKDSSSAVVNPDVPLNLLESSGWMLCDGRSLNTKCYPELFCVLGYLYGRNGDEFRIPDYRGLFLRGVDAGSGMDPDASRRIAPTGEGVSSGVGSLQCDSVQVHTHTYKSATLAAVSQSGNAASQASSDEATSGPDKPARTSSETRSRNVSVNYIINFK